MEASIAGLLTPGIAKALPAYGAIVDDSGETTLNDYARWCAYALQAIDDGVASSSAMLFKVGITSHPAHRWLNCRYGYYTTERWRFMRLVATGPARHCCELERRAIAYGREKHPSACQNRAPGGEGVGREINYQHWIYIVFEVDPTERRTNMRWLYEGHRAGCETCRRYEREDS